ncbi:conserved hypothetical protein [Trichinella spiralis]|uniref:hypothetical protein n=1 Tax=Trichinella spiralis TaxID=6334 RepID=UPI0001EFDE71|nr:conserved hypothetical protein [Trichinella spiralis]
MNNEEKSENGVDAKRNADGIMQNNKREKRIAMQITIAIKGALSSIRAHSFVDLRGKW